MLGRHIFWHKKLLYQGHDQGHSQGQIVKNGGKKAFYRLTLMKITPNT